MSTHERAPWWAAHQQFPRGSRASATRLRGLKAARAPPAYAMLAPLSKCPGGLRIPARAR
jgi:hypothetical protein